MSSVAEISADRMIGELVVENPNRSRVFEQFGIDYCCGGRQTLSAACTKAKVDLDRVLALLEQNDRAGGNEATEPDWSVASLSELARHIVERHHVYLRGELPRLAKLVFQVVSAHADRHPELREVGRVFAGLQAELSTHMMKEERVLFPIVEMMEAAAAKSEGMPPCHCGSVGNPIRVMEHEHQDAGDALARMRSLTNGYAPPPDACPTYHALLDGLKRLESDLHVHIHKENNILFPRAAALEKQLNG
jgi:regulator of cell morphogenesis and NO signaling